MKRPIIFLDDGGVLNDNQKRGEQWQRLVGEFFTPILGGEPEAWGEANRVYATALFEKDAWLARIRAHDDYESFDRAYMRDWMTAMCRLVGIACPPEEESIALAREANDWVVSRVRAAFPGVVETIRLLHKEGYLLHTASGASARDMASLLRGMGVLDCFDRLYGPDLINTMKSGPLFYERLLADVGVDPAHALVLDDNAHMAAWAQEVGARTVLVGATRAGDGVGSEQLRINSLAELPNLLEKIT